MGLIKSSWDRLRIYQVRTGPVVQDRSSQFGSSQIMSRHVKLSWGTSNQVSTGQVILGLVHSDRSVGNFLDPKFVWPKILMAPIFF